MQLPMFPLRIVLFPQGPLPLRIFEARYVDMVRRCMHESLDFGVLLILAGSEVGPSTTVEVGTTAHIADFHQLADGLLGISCVGRRRFRVQQRALQGDGLNLADVVLMEEDLPRPVPARHAPLADLVRGVLPQLGELYADMELRVDDAAWLGYRLAEILPIDVTHKQRCLEMDDPIERLDFLAPLIRTATAGTLPPTASVN